jgi:hypothetical protein
MVALLDHLKCIRGVITVGDQEAEINHIGNIFLFKWLPALRIKTYELKRLK